MTMKIDNDGRDHQIRVIFSMLAVFPFCSTSTMLSRFFYSVWCCRQFVYYICAFFTLSLWCPGEMRAPSTTVKCFHCYFMLFGKVCQNALPKSRKADEFVHLKYFEVKKWNSKREQQRECGAFNASVNGVWTAKANPINTYSKSQKSLIFPFLSRFQLPWEKNQCDSLIGDFCENVEIEFIELKIQINVQRREKWMRKRAREREREIWEWERLHRHARKFCLH